MCEVLFNFRLLTVHFDTRISFMSCCQIMTHILYLHVRSKVQYSCLSSKCIRYALNQTSTYHHDVCV